MSVCPAGEPAVSLPRDRRGLRTVARRLWFRFLVEWRGTLEEDEEEEQWLTNQRID